MSRGKILVVDDNRPIRDMLALGLQLEGYTVREAVDGLEALEIIASEPLPDLILLDMLMPRMNGWEFVDVVKRDPASPVYRIPIVAVTATSEKVQRTPGELQGVIRKPLEFDELYRMVRRFFPDADSQLRHG